MNVFWHAGSAIALLAVGCPPAAAVGAIVPDVTWVANEWRFRTSGYYSWHRWAKDTLIPRMVMPYRLAHSALVVPPVCLLFDAHWFLLGWAVHIIMDLPTHRGVMQQMPLYPIKWRWPWLLI